MFLWLPAIWAKIVENLNRLTVGRNGYNKYAIFVFESTSLDVTMILFYFYSV